MRYTRLKPKEEDNLRTGVQKRLSLSGLSLPQSLFANFFKGKDLHASTSS